MQISLSGDRPQELKAIVNAVQDVYKSKYVDRVMQERKERFDRLEKNAADTKTEIETLTKEMFNNAKKGRDVTKETVALKQKLAMQLLEDTKREIIKTEADLRRSQRTGLKIALNDKAQLMGSTSVILDDQLDSAMFPCCL